MKFEVKQSVYDGMKRVYTSDRRGKMGVLGGPADERIIDTVVWADSTGGCPDSPSISRKNTAIAFMKLVEQGKIMKGLFRWVNGGVEEAYGMNAYKYARSPHWALSENMREMTHASKYPVLFMIGNEDYMAYYLGCKQSKKWRCRAFREHIYRHNSAVKTADGRIVSFYELSDLRSIEERRAEKEEQKKIVALETTGKVKVSLNVPERRVIKMNQADILAIHRQEVRV